MMPRSKHQRCAAERRKLALAIDDLRRRLDAAGRDPATVDIAFANPAGGSPAAESFDVGALGVTWIQVGLPGDSVSHVRETLERYGELVIAHA